MRFDADFVQNAINAVLALYVSEGRATELGADELRRAQGHRLNTPQGLFGAAWRLANGSRALADKVPTPVRDALFSVAYAAYVYCAGLNARFAPSRDQVQSVLPETGPLELDQALEIFAQVLDVPPDGDQPTTTELRVSASDATEPTTADASPALAQPPPDQHEAITAIVPIATETLPGRRVYRFAAPPSLSIRERFESLVAELPKVTAGADSNAQHHAVDALRQTLTTAMAVGDAGRTFTEFAALKGDVDQLAQHLLLLATSDAPRTVQDRARASRRIAESIDFNTASPEDYRYSRYAWLLSCFWNSQLTRYWATNRPNAIYDFLGYLSVIQAEIRYSDADFLLLLRVSFSICRIASHDGLVPQQFLTTAAEHLPEWIRYTAGTILASAGPGRVPPSRIPYDTRLGSDRRQYAATLLASWRTDADRAAAATILLEMGAWDPVRVTRLLEHCLSGEPHEKLEVWTELVQVMARRAKRVRVVRPNPWSAGSSKPLTVEREAVAVLAADVVERNYQVLGGDLALRGHDFRERRVPTFVCSADFGPLGLFKLDLADRIVREVDNFVRYAQRLHPRYRAGRCDSSKAVITEPDDAKQFIQGALTSYVFTEDETPTTLREWFQNASRERASALCTELFEKALRPWYGHATAATIDVFSEFPIFSLQALERLVKECESYHGLRIAESSERARPVEWIRQLLRCLDGDTQVTPAIGRVASELQVQRSYRSICHGDLHLDNILVVGKPGAEYPSVIDFEATHEGYVLKDYGRFAAALLFRAFDWSPDERAYVLEKMPAGLTTWSEDGLGKEPATEALAKVIDALLITRRGILRAWQAGSYPGKVEVVTALVASFLPFARYPDTSSANAELCLDLSSRLVASLF